MSRNIYITIALTLIVVVGTLAYWEWGVRLLAPAAFPLLRTDPEVGTIHVKNYDDMAWSARSQKYTHIRTNSLGYIGDEIIEQKPPHTIRIAVVGDSVVEGLEVNTDDTFPALFERMLSENKICGEIAFEVMNFGVSGTGTFLQYQALKKNILPLKPDYIFMVFHNDYEDNLAKSQYDLENFANERRSVGLKSFLLQFELPKFLFSKVQTNATVRAALRYAGLLEGSPIVHQETLTDADMPADSPIYQYTFQIIRRFDDLVRKNDATLILIPYPQDPNSLDTGAWHADLHFTYLADFARGAKITLWDPSPYLAAQRSKGIPFTNGTDNHLTEPGHKALAEFLFEKASREIVHDLGCRAR